MVLKHNSREPIYRQRAQRYGQREQLLGQRDRMLGNARAAVFVVAAFFLVNGIITDQGNVISYIACSAFMVVFFALVVIHERVTNDLSRNRELRRINEQFIARLHRRWNELPTTAVFVPDDHQAVANDLDLFGHASVFHFLSQANTPMGLETLRDCLLYPVESTEVLRRQEAVAELAPLIDLREELNLRGRMLVSSFTGPEHFVEWAESEGWLAQRPWLKWLARALTSLIAALVALAIAKLLPPEICIVAVLVLLSINLLLTIVFSSTIHDVFNQVSSKDGEVTHYGVLFELMYQMPVTSKKMRMIEYDATKHGKGVLQGLRSLRWVMLLAGVRHSPLAFILFYLPMQLFALWDVHIADLLESWQRRYGKHARVWFDALGHFEALASLASLQHDYRDWAIPTIDERATKVTSRALGHPLLADDARVTNDVEIGPDGTFLLVTGSNMSGKSTLLRSIGVNVKLAQAGSAVCAAELVLPPVTVTTSIRIRDSLEEGVSYYMAELKRLKQIVDQSRNYQSRSDRRLLYLLDEILLGTNSTERHIAVVRVLTHLLDLGAIGAVSTHDLELATTEPLASRCQLVHFRETLENGGMTFDYHMRAGVATTSNALKLMEMVGLDQPT